MRNRTNKRTLAFEKAHMKLLLSKFTSILFDCDGVLVDSEPAMAEISALAYQDFGAPATAADFLPYIGQGEQDYFGQVAQKYGLVFDDTIRTHIYAKYIDLAQRFVRPFPGVRDLVRSLKAQGYRIAVASSSVKVKVDVNLSVLKLPEQTFDAVLTGSDLERKKPYPDIYLLAAERLAASPEECLVIEDSTSGVIAGKSAGMTVIGFTSAHTGAELKAAGADFVVDDLSNVLMLREAGLWKPEWI